MTTTSRGPLRTATAMPPRPPWRLPNTATNAGVPGALPSSFCRHTLSMPAFSSHPTRWLNHQHAPACLSECQRFGWVELTSLSVDRSVVLITHWVTAAWPYSFDPRPLCGGLKLKAKCSSHRKRQRQSSASGPPRRFVQVSMLAPSPSPVFIVVIVVCCTAADRGWRRRRSEQQVASSGSERYAKARRRRRGQQGHQAQRTSRRPRFIGRIAGIRRGCWSRILALPDPQ